MKNNKQQKQYFILRMLNEDYKSEGESKYIYLQDEGKDVDMITQNKKHAKVFDQDAEVKVHNTGWQFIRIK